jgi:hypothetical protein
MAEIADVGMSGGPPAGDGPGGQATQASAYAGLEVEGRGAI